MQLSNVRRPSWQRLLGLLCSWLLQVLVYPEFNFLAAIELHLFRMWGLPQAGMLLTYLPSVVHDRCALCGVFCKATESFKTFKKHEGSAEKGDSEEAGESELVSASLCSLR